MPGLRSTNRREGWFHASLVLVGHVRTCIQRGASGTGQALSRLPAHLDSHRGYDAGAQELAQAFADALSAPLRLGQFTRLLVDLNRSATNRRVFSELTPAHDRTQRAELLALYHQPYRRDVEAVVNHAVARNRVVIHLSIHTFHPRPNGVVRNADVAWLYDPAHGWEKPFCQTWRDALRRRQPHCRVRFNYPYRGVSDGLTTHLRRRHGAGSYLGIEVEVNQRWLQPRNRQAWQQLASDLVSTVPRQLG